ncbi:interferon beta-like [Huso huso]|uniref:Interferon beta-like n=1 Tax=Huso huso TaxID=61971 RepID=A0ABR0YKD7_HUSHU
MMKTMLAQCFCVLVACSPALFLECNGDTIQLKLINDSLHLLQDMGGKFPNHCMKEVTGLSVQFRSLIHGKEETDILWTIHNTFKLASNLYNSDLKSVDWDEFKLNEFKDLLYRQADEFKRDALEVTKTHPVNGTPKRKRRPRLRKYFKTLRTFLRRKEHSLCAWEVVRSEVREILQQLASICNETTRRN